MATYVVTTATDENNAGATEAAPGGTGLSLREAVALANANGGADTIQFAASLDGQTLTLTSGQLTSTDVLTIDGDRNDDHIADITISGGGVSRIIRAFADLAFDGLVLTGGNSGHFNSGGAIFSNSGTVTVSYSTLVGNIVGSSSTGGAIWAINVVLNNSTVSGNTATTGGGGIEANNLTVVNSTFSGNIVTGNGGGGAIIAATSANLLNTTITGNKALQGGGIYYNGSLTLENSIVSGNKGGEMGDASGVSTLITNGGNIIGGDVYQGGAIVGSPTSAAAIFASTVDIGGVLAGVLANNGGGFQTVALNTALTNPALDAASTSAPALDSRGKARADLAGVANSNGSAADLGAFELVPLPDISVAAASASKAEGQSGSTAFTFTVTRTGDISGASSANWAVTGAAVTAADFGGALPSGTVNFAASETSKVITVNVSGDLAVEPNEDFTITLSAPSGATIANASANGTIIADDGPTLLADNLTGTDNNDTINLLTGDDIYDGLGGDDLITGGGGNDQLSGGSGNDFFFIKNSGVQVHESIGGGVDDRIYTGVNFTLGANEEIEILATSSSAAGGVTLGGNNLDNLIFGSDGNDHINGFGGLDRLYGGLGDDLLEGGAGDDYLIGGAGNDTYGVDTSGDVIIESASAGNDTLIASFNYALAADVSIETLRTATGSSGLYLSGNNLVNNMLGGSGAEHLFGGGGNDVLDGAGGGDYLIGGTGDDVYIISHYGDVIIETTGDIADRLIASVSYALGAAANVEFLSTAEGSSGLRLFGNGLANVMSGNEGIDYLYGGGGNDSLQGGKGSDALSGDAGDDTYIFRMSEFVRGVNDQVYGFGESVGDNDTLQLQGNSGNYIFADHAGYLLVTHVTTGGTIQIFGYTAAQIADQVQYTP